MTTPKPPEAQPDWLRDLAARVPRGNTEIIKRPGRPAYFFIDAEGNARKLKGRARNDRWPDQLVQAAYNLLDEPNPPTDLLRETLISLMAQRKKMGLSRRGWRAGQSDWLERLVALYRTKFGRDPLADEVGLRRAAPIQCGPPGKPWGTFRSPWEKRLADALTRLGVQWLYEPRSFDWYDGQHHWHAYTPDFALTDFSMTYVEVKGPSGAPGDDQYKMAQVLASHPRLTLLLWDAAVIEHVEDMDRADQLLALLHTTKLAA